MVVDAAPLADDHFFFCYDKQYSPFRVTLYTNLQPDLAAETGRHRVTIEVLSDDPLEADGLIEKSLSELIDMSIFPENSQLMYGIVMPIAQGFPVLTKSLENAKANLIGEVTDKCRNLKLLGRNCSDVWFMHEVLRQVHEEFS